VGDDIGQHGSNSNSSSSQTTNVNPPIPNACQDFVFFSDVWGMRSYLLKNPETETETKAATAEQQVTKNNATKM